MTAASAVFQRPLDAEWERVDLLGQCLARSRQGQAMDNQALKRLQGLQDQVSRNRLAGGPWQALGAGGLSPLEYDILACAVAVEAEPRLGWLFRQLQSGQPQPYPTPALLQELLALEGGELAELYAALGEGAALVERRLIQAEAGDPYQPVRPQPGVSARLLGRPLNSKAPPGASRVHLRASWDDLVLPPANLTQLREFLLWVTHRRKVVSEWGGLETGGPVALFAGPSGTGKTFAAAVLAQELGWPLYRVDLGRLVSKYIGETEKNLNRLFDAAHDSKVILQFDEADSLFSKRGEVKEARDRYANLEVSHLLARIEDHHGPCILTTNLREHLDPAFARRFQLVVEFRRPDADARARLWARLLPPRAPRDAQVDPQFLGTAVSLSGGGIRNAALHAAYLAAAAQRPITLEHVATAVWRELTKAGWEATITDLGPLAEYLPHEVYQ